MEPSSLAQWLNSALGGFDFAILEFYHTLATPFLTFVASFFTLIGEKGLLGFALGFVLLLFRKTRRCGICIIGAIGLGAIMTNFILKDLIARPRPFLSDSEVSNWWQSVGAHAEDGFSFPSGHVTAAMAAMTALPLCLGKKWIAPAAAYVALMAFSRNYLMAHYPTDVIAACFVGGIAALLAFLIVKVGYRILEKHRDKRLFGFILDADIRTLCTKKQK